MYIPIDACQLPENLESRIWRYIDIPKLVALLDKRSLYFSRADLLGDPFEGSHPKTFSKTEFKLVIEQGEKKQEITLSSEAFYSALRRNTFINCWHLNPDESHAMWSVYLHGQPGVAIQSTSNRLISALSIDEQHKVNIGHVRYIDYETDSFPDENQTIHGFLYKHKCYEHERELRAIIRADHIPASIFSPDKVPLGKAHPVDLDVLVERIVLPPDASPWFEKVVTSLLRRYGLVKVVAHSSIPRKPQW